MEQELQLGRDSAQVRQEAVNLVEYSEGSEEDYLGVLSIHLGEGSILDYVPQVTFEELCFLL